MAGVVTTRSSQWAPVLIAALEDADDSVCAQALATLRVVGADPKPYFPP